MVGKYGVDIKGFEDFLESVPFLNPATNLIVIDESEKMECLVTQVHWAYQEYPGFGKAGHCYHCTERWWGSLKRQRKGTISGLLR